MSLPAELREDARVSESRRTTTRGDDDEPVRACSARACSVRGPCMHACMRLKGSLTQRLTHSKARPKRIQSASIQTTSNRRPAGLPTLASSSCPNKCKCKMQNAKCKVANGFMAVHASTVYATTSATTGKRLQQMNSFVRRKACASKRASKPILLCTICMAWHAWAFTFTSL